MSSNHLIQGFPFVASFDAEILILGSMPGVKSLNAAEYYAHPRNAFWKIMSDVYMIPLGERYEVRLTLLKQSKVALWDVIRACERVGSLDSDIQKKSLLTNDFEAFFTDHKTIKKVLFNGQKAEAIFKEQVSPKLFDPKSSLELLLRSSIEFHILPSTSPANARMTYETKKTAWEKYLI